MITPAKIVQIFLSRQVENKTSGGVVHKNHPRITSHEITSYLEHIFKHYFLSCFFFFVAVRVGVIVTDAMCCDGMRRICVGRCPSARNLCGVVCVCVSVHMSKCVCVTCSPVPRHVTVLDLSVPPVPSVGGRSCERHAVVMLSLVSLVSPEGSLFFVMVVLSLSLSLSVSPLVSRKWTVV